MKLLGRKPTKKHLEKRKSLGLVFGFEGLTLMQAIDSLVSSSAYSLAAFTVGEHGEHATSDVGKGNADVATDWSTLVNSDFFQEMFGTIDEDDDGVQDCHRCGKTFTSTDKLIR